MNKKNIQNGDGTEYSQDLANDESRRMFHTLLSNLPGMVYRCHNDPNWTMVFVSNGASGLTGYNAADFVSGQVTYGSLIHPEDSGRVWSEIQSALADKQHFEIEYRIRDASGNEISVWERGQGIYDSQGDLRFLEGFITDITERKRAEKALQDKESFIRSVLNNLPIGIAVNSVDPNVQFDYMNDLFPHYYRTTREALARPDGFWEAVYQDPDFREKIERKILDDCTSGDPERMNWVDVPITRQGEETTYITARNIPIASEKLMISVVWDVTERKRTLDTLRINEERLNLALEATNVGLWDWMIQSGEMYFSPQYFKMLGYEPNELPCRYDTWHDLLHPDDQRQSLEKLQDYFSGAAQKYDVEFRLRTKGGDWKWILSRGRIVERDGQGLPIRMIGTHSDITERKHNEEALRNETYKINSILRAAPTGIGVMVNRVFKEVNDRVCEMTGYSRDEMLNRNALFVYPTEEEYERVGRVKYAQIVSQGTGTIETQWRRKDGSIIDVLLSSTPIEPNNLEAGITFTALDITERKRFENEMKDSNRRKDEFLAMLAHELRNPLEPIRCSLHVLSQLLPDKPELSKQHEIIDRQLTHMSRLVDDLLDVSRITRGMISLQKARLDLRDVANRVVETIKPRIDRRNLKFEYHRFPDPIWVDGDLTRLEQVLNNLLDNSIKYSQPGGQIELHLTVEPPGAQNSTSVAKVRICDNGVGIGADVLSQVFDLFFQADRSLDRAQGGLGIGLTMAKRLVEMHGGEIHVSSAGVGQGSEFFFYLPLMPDVSVADKQTEAKKDVSKHRILVVEDIPDAAESLACLLEIWGHEARVAYNGPEAINVAMQFQPDVVLLDIGLPGENGYEVARRLREEIGLKDARLVAITGYGREEDIQKGKEAGFSFHLTKPVDLDILQSIL